MGEMEAQEVLAEHLLRDPGYATQLIPRTLSLAGPLVEEEQRPCQEEEASRALALQLEKEE